MNLRPHKTKIVGTIGPASESPEMIERLLRAGLNVARLNFSHGDFASHQRVIETLRSASQRLGWPVAILADLPGPKMRVGQLEPEPIELRPGAEFTLTTEDLVGTPERVSVSFRRLPEVVKPGDMLFLNDGLVHLRVMAAAGSAVRCQVVVGGELSSRKGLNLPGIDLGMSAFTSRDRAGLEFAAEQRLDAVSQSFVETAADVRAVRAAAAALGYEPFLIAKIERAGALKHIDQILAEADGIMVARGDLGVEIPLEKITEVQKTLIRQANRLAKPVITATQMLESMVTHRLPTRAEATDVANAILDGTDCLMLSAESAVGKYPVEAVAMLAKIAAEIEPDRAEYQFGPPPGVADRQAQLSLADVLSLGVQTTVEHLAPTAVVVPTVSGQMARMLARFHLPTWTVAVSTLPATCQQLQFSYGVHAEHVPDYPADWNGYVGEWLRSHKVAGSLALLVRGPSPKNPHANYCLEMLQVKGGLT